MENFKAMENMKRLETLCIAGAVAVLAVSCGKEEAVREDGASKVGFTAAELQVKTVFGEKADGEYLEELSAYFSMPLVPDTDIFLSMEEESENYKP